MPALLKPIIALATAALLHTVLPEALATSPSARLLIDGEATHFVGEAFAFFVVIENSGPIPDPELPPSEDLALHFDGAVASETEGSRRYTLSLQAVPLRAGKLVLPPIDLAAGGTPLRTPAHDLIVKEPAQTEEMRLEVTLSQERCYVREPVTLTFSWQSRLSFNGIRALRSRVSALDHALLRTHPTLTDIRPDNPRAIGIPVGGERIIARIDASGDDSQPDRISFQRVLVPTRPGIIEIPAATLVCAFTPPQQNRFKTPRYPSYFNNDFFNQDLPSDYQQIYCRSQPLRLEVLPLPDAGKPEGFQDEDIVVGNLSLDVQANPKTLEAGSPLTLTVRATGHPFPQTLEFPNLENISSAGLHFDLAPTAAPTRLDGREAVVVYSLRPRHERVTEIPAIRIPCFDPASASYGNAVSEPIPIRVLPEARASASLAEFRDGSRIQNIIRPAQSGLCANHEGPDLLSLHRGPRPLTSSPLWWFFLATPPAVFVVALLRQRRATRIARDPDGYRARRAYREFRRARSAGRPARETAGNYLADRLRRRRGTDSLAELAHIARQQGAPGATVETLQKLDMQKLAAIYGDDSPAAHEAATESQTLDDAVDQIETANPSHKL